MQGGCRWYVLKKGACIGGCLGLHGESHAATLSTCDILASAATISLTAVAQLLIMVDVATAAQYSSAIIVTRASKYISSTPCSTPPATAPFTTCTTSSPSYSVKYFTLAIPSVSSAAHHSPSAATITSTGSAAVSSARPSTAYNPSLSVASSSTTWATPTSAGTAFGRVTRSQYCRHGSRCCLPYALCCQRYPLLQCVSQWCAAPCAAAPQTTAGAAHADEPCHMTGRQGNTFANGWSFCDYRSRQRCVTRERRQQEC